MNWTLAQFRNTIVVGIGIAVALISVHASADPPSRAIRISFTSGNASFSPAGSDVWLEARVNRPIWIGDRLWSGDGRAELQLGGSSLRLAPRTSLQVLNFDDRLAQFEVTQGSVALHVRAIDGDDAIEIDTPSFALVARERGDYRVNVERDRTSVSTRRGSADIYGQNVSYRIDRREQFVFYSPDLRDYDAGPLPPPDAFDSWARERSLREDRSASSRYLAPELVGYADLDSYGEWRVDASYGNVWIPRVTADWAPYRFGHWTWIDPWGWTWIDDAPWGYAPSHYGRWTQLGRTWAWVPGPRDVRPVYAPAVVAWIGGENFSLSVASGRTRAVGWFPLAPGEVWRPSYNVSREYFTRVNVSNTIVNNTTVVNIYNNTRNDVRIANVDYRFRGAPAAVTAVPVETFVQSRPVQATQAQFNANAAAQANVLVAPTVTPSVQSIVGSAQRTQARPPSETLQRAVVARTAPAAVPTIEQRATLVRDGQPVDRQALERVVPQTPQAAQPVQPQRPQTAAPGPVPAPSPTPPPARADGQAPAMTVAPGQLRANVRVLEADKAPPQPLPTGPSDGGRRAVNEDRAQPRGQPPQTAQPPRPAEAPQPSQPARAVQPPQPPQVAQPPQPPQPARAVQPPQPPPVAQPPQSLQAPPAPNLPQAPAATPRAPEGQPPRAAVPQSPASADSGDRPGRREGRGGGADDRAVPAAAPPAPVAPPAPAATPRPASPAAQPVPPSPPVVAAPPPPRPADGQRPAAPPPPAAPASPPPQPAAQPAPPSVQPAQPLPPGRPPGEQRRDDRDGDRGKDGRRDRDRDKDKEQDKDKDKDKDKGKG
ncbi:MAG TPA: DUF6600 domain-containing protein [Casimicrobiaceae bacterium]|nr:DUF6600 domain-containing protein [Casimicrobiaceae bacterium]